MKKKKKKRGREEETGSRQQRSRCLPATIHRPNTLATQDLQVTHVGCYEGVAEVRSREADGLFDGGGEREGMVGIEGIVVGMVGSGVEGNGGSVTFGAVGKVGSVGFGKDGIWVVGKGGNVAFGRLGNGVDGNGGRVGCVGSVGNGVDGNGGSVALGRVGCVGRVGNGVEGNGGKVGLGKEGTEGNGGKVAFGRGGIVGRDNAGGGAAAGVSKRWRAASVISKLCKLNAARKDNRKQCLKGIAIVCKEIRKRKL
ncbi:hypothetical protein LWI28_019990 [Acer negundo]|uniref:Uncharacterized protein n=1 Tax=Acer negundo TaxID=4023 RepID=A0AAD5NL71_ACENE|nr:hypothetical protein LWI28_019990 [Acer negundo]